MDVLVGGFNCIGMLHSMMERGTALMGLKF